MIGVLALAFCASCTSDHYQEKDLAREATVKKLNDQALIAEVAQHGKDKYLRLMVIKFWLDDQCVLAAIAINDPAVIRCEALHKLNDEALLADIEKNDVDNNVRYWARERLGELHEKEWRDSIQ